MKYHVVSQHEDVPRQEDPNQMEEEPDDRNGDGRVDDATDLLYKDGVVLFCGYKRLQSKTLLIYKQDNTRRPAIAKTFCPGHYHLFGA